MFAAKIDSATRTDLLQYENVLVDRVVADLITTHERRGKTQTAPTRGCLPHQARDDDGLFCAQSVYASDRLSHQRVVSYRRRATVKTADDLVFNRDVPPRVDLLPPVRAASVASGQFAATGQSGKASRPETQIGQLVAAI